ncbi:MAG: DNA repair protein RecN, partial [Pseudomonadota bacterium]
MDLAPMRAAWTAVAAARKALVAARAQAKEARAEEDFLRHAVEEFDKLQPEATEDADLDSRRRLMQAAERIRSDVTRAFEAIGPQGAEGQMVDATRWLETASDAAGDALTTAMDALSRAMTELGEAQAGVERCLDALTFNPHELEDVEERLFAIRAIARKHGVQPADLPGFADDLRARLALIDNSDGALGALEAAFAEA